MSKYQEALDYLAEHSAYENVTRDGESWKEVTQRGADALDLIQGLVDKATPKKPTGEYTDRKCSECGTRLRSGSGSSSRTRDTVCRNCFQVADWEES